MKYWRSNMSVKTKKTKTNKILEIFLCNENQHNMFNLIKATMTSLSMSSAGESDEKVHINTRVSG